MSEKVTIAYACIYISVVLMYLVKSMLYVRNKRWPRATLKRKKRNVWPKAKKKKKNNKAEGLNEKKMKSTKCL